MNRECRVCGSAVYGRSDKVYCSSKCRRDASRVRRQRAMTDPQDRRQALPQLSPVDQKHAGFLLGGVEVDERAVRDLVRILDRPLARKLDVALLSSAKMVRLSSHERRDALAGLAYAQGDLQSLRESLLTDPAWRRW